ncbi:hypothetical protein KY321_05615 [Candidatus Woesearchaeota archaeon]|nr:hypothetical protein [Candidatus Woesearchaeota archaeon]
MAKKKLSLKDVPSPKKAKETKKSVKKTKSKSAKKVSRFKIISKLALFKSIVFVSIMVTFSFVLSYSTYMVPNATGERFSPQGPQAAVFMLSLLFGFIFLVSLAFTGKEKIRKKKIDLKIFKTDKGIKLKNIKIKPEDELIKSLDVSKELSKIKRSLDKLEKF